MSTVKANNVQVGQSGTATNNFTLYQPSTPDGTVRLAVGNSGATSADVLTANSSGNVGIGTSSPAVKLDVVGFTNITNASTVLSGTAKGTLRLYDSTSMASGVGAGLAFLGQATTGSGAYTTAGSIQAYKVNGTSGNDAFGLQFTTRSNGSGCATVMNLDDNGNLGLGVTPSGWVSTRKAFQTQGGAVFTGTDTSTIGVIQNGFNDGTGWKYVNTGFASRYYQNSSIHAWDIAASGTAGNAITFTQAMTLDASGNLGVGTTSPGSFSGGNQDYGAVIGNGTALPGLTLYGGSSNGGSLNFADGTTGTEKYRGSVEYNHGSDYMAFRTSGTIRVRIGSGGEVYFPGVGTTASAANAYLDNGSSPANQLLRSTSSLRYKTDVETLDHAKADAVLNLRPVWYRSKAEADRKDWSWYGLIAEEVAQVEPRLVHWSYPEDQFETIETQTEIEKTREVEVTPAVLDDEGNIVEPAVTETETYTETETKSERKLKADAQLAPDGVQYDRLTVMLLDIVKRQNQRIEQLEAKVAALEAQ